MPNNKIVYVFEGLHHLQYLPSVLKKNHKNYSVYGNYENDEEMLSKVNELIDQGAKVIVTSGGYYDILTRNVDIPLIPVKRNWASIPSAVQMARRNSEKVGILAKHGVFQFAAERYKTNHMDDIPLKIFSTNEQCEQMLKLYKERGIDTLICGSRGSRIAPSYGFNVIVVPFDEEDIMTATREAEHILGYLEMTEQTSSILKIIQNSVNKSIIAVDINHRVTEINNFALNALGISRSDIYGKTIEKTTLSPIAQLENFKTHSPASSELVIINDKLCQISLVPILGDYPMTVITLSEISNVKVF